MRKLTVDGVKYEWTVGRAFLLVKGGPLKRQVVSMENLFRSNSAVIERAAWKGYFSGVRPQDVADFIRFGYSTSDAYRDYRRYPLHTLSGEEYFDWTGLNYELMGPEQPLRWEWEYETQAKEPHGSGEKTNPATK